jgi:hypothetical protein
VTLTIPTEFASKVLRDMRRFDLIETNMLLLQVAKEEPGERNVANDDRWSVSRHRQVFPKLGQRVCSIERAVRHDRFLGELKEPRIVPPTINCPPPGNAEPGK